LPRGPDATRRQGTTQALSLSKKPYEETVRELVGSGRPMLWTLILVVGVVELAILFL
jgi:hypothetical protein